MEKETNNEVLQNSQFETEAKRDEAITEGVTEYVKRSGRDKKEGLSGVDRAVAIGVGGLIVASVLYPASQSYFSNRGENNSVLNENEGNEAVEENTNTDMPETIVVGGKTYTLEIPNEETTEENTSEAEESEVNNKRAEIEADRTYSFSQVVARINHYPDTVERDELLYWDVNESAGQITVTRPYGEHHEDNPHNEKVEFEFYPNDEQAILEWNELDLRANLPAGAFWLQVDSTGGAAKVEFFNENGEILRKHEGEMVTREWTDKNGKTQTAIQFKDNVTGETRPASFQTFEIIFDEETGEAIDIEYPYHSAKVTFEPTPGSRMNLVTGPTVHFNPDNPYGPDHDQGFGFYMWDKETETK